MAFVNGDKTTVVFIGTDIGGHFLWSEKLPRAIAFFLFSGSNKR